MSADAFTIEQYALHMAGGHGLMEASIGNNEGPTLLTGQYG